MITTILGAAGSIASFATKLMGMVGKYLIYQAGQRTSNNKHRIKALELESELKDDYKENRENKPSGRADNLNRLHERAARNKRLP